jgi:hypothetical protein
MKIFESMFSEAIIYMVGSILVEYVRHMYFRFIFVGEYVACG